MHVVKGKTKIIVTSFIGAIIASFLCVFPLANIFIQQENLFNQISETIRTNLLFMMSTGVLFLMFYLLLNNKKILNILQSLAKHPNYIKNRNIIIALFIGTILFIMLYYKFIYYGEAYIFSLDLNADTLDLLYPYYHLINESLHSGSFPLYTLQMGFGMSTIGMLSSVANPLNMLLFFVNADHIEIALIISIYIKTMIVIFFAVKYFQLILNHSKVILITSLLWGFNSYFIIWGQQYGFGNNIVYFTMFLYVLHKLCSKQTCRVSLIIVLVLLSINGYYFFYSMGVFSILYIFIYHFIKKATRKELFQCIIKLIGYTCIAVSITAFLLLPSVLQFLNSARTEGITQNALQVFRFVDIKTIVSMLGRLYSPNLLGTALEGSLYATQNQSLNYYEMAFLNTSILSIYAIVYVFLSSKRNKKIKLTMLLIVLLSLSTYIFSFIFVYAFNFRWTYILIFIEVLFIGLFIEYLYTHRSITLHKKVSNYSILIIFIINAVLLIADKKNIIHMDIQILFVTNIFAISFYVLIHFWRKNFPIILPILLISEIIFQNYAPINHRGTETIKQLKQNYYYDGTIESIKQLEHYDTSLYRINKNYLSRFYNDAMVQGYYGVAVYNSLNTAQLQSLLHSYGVTSEYSHPNYYRIKSDDALLNGLFGVKYFVESDVQENGEAVVTSPFPVYLNPYYLPFGFLYDNCISEQSIYQDDIILSVLSGYTSETKSGINFNPSQYYEKQNIIMTYSNDQYVSQGTINVKTDLDKITLSCSNNAEVKGFLYIANDETFENSKCIEFIVDEHANTSSVIIPEEYLNSSIYIKVVFENNDAKLESVEVKVHNFNMIMNQINIYRSQSLEHVKNNGDHITGEIENKSSQTKMLFIPLIYSNEWKVMVDGVEKDIENINGGFLGVEIEPGKHEVVFQFNPMGFHAGLWISGFSIFSIIVYLIRKQIKKYRN